MDTLIGNSSTLTMNSSTLTMKRDCGEEKSGYYGTATLKRAQIHNIPYIKWAYEILNVSHLKIRKVMRP